MMECLYAKCTPCITDCVMAELEKLGEKYRVALKIAKDPRYDPNHLSLENFSHSPHQAFSPLFPVQPVLYSSQRIFRIVCRFEKLPCNHKGTYADDCLCERVRQHRCYIVATCDKDLRRRIRKIPGVPIMYIQSHQYHIERMPETAKL